FDEYAVDLAGGDAIDFSLRGGESTTECPGRSCPLDVRLEVRDEDGTLLAADDDGEPPYDALVGFAAPHDATFVVPATTSGPPAGPSVGRGPTPGSPWGSGHRSGRSTLPLARSAAER